MALSNTERQRQYKQRQREKGLMQKVVWADRDGFTGLPDASGARPRITRNKFTRELSKLAESMNKASAEEVYAELLAAAKQLKASGNLNRQSR